MIEDINDHESARNGLILGVSFLIEFIYKLLKKTTNNINKDELRDLFNRLKKSIDSLTKEEVISFSKEIINLRNCWIWI